ncbi:MAG: SpoIIE family protein phosphatase, partial [Planctomycetota bacterium]
IAGPPIDALDLEAPGPVVLGRSTTADRQLPDKTVSRKHGRIWERGSSWFIADLDSRHGTYLNGIKLDAEQPAPIGDGDLVRIGPWTFRVRDYKNPASSSIAIPTNNDLASTAHRVQRVPVRELRSVAQQRLDLLIECAAGINGASSLQDLADESLKAVVTGTGFSRAAFIRQVSATGDIELVAARGVSGEIDGSDFAFSRSLINAASAGEIVRMAGDGGVNYGESIIRLGIHSALCAPIMLGASVEAYLYLDARDAESSVEHDAAAFCQAVSKMSGLALANLKRVELESHRRSLETDLKAARAAQRLIMPPASETLGKYTYAMRTKPGRMVAGDLFDAVPLDDPNDPEGRLAVLLGDVAGKGVGAAILMATAQTYLRLALEHDDDPGRVVTALNAHVAPRVSGGMFLTLWLGVLCPKTNTLDFVDGGHGHWLIARPDEPAAKHQCNGGLLVGIDPAMTYTTESTEFTPGSRLILFSDGLVEQPDADNIQFGIDRAVEVLQSTATPRDDVNELDKAVHAHAGQDHLADDLTLASIHYARD